MKPLLLLVDLQRDYLDAPGLDPAAEQIVARARALLDGCREAGVPVAHAVTTISREDDRRMPHWRREDRWLCVRGTPGHAPGPGLEPREGEPVIEKTTFTPFETGELDRVLREQGSELLLVAGVHAHACVRHAVLDAYQRHGIEIWVAADATGSDDPVHAAITRRYLEDRAARYVSVDEALARLRAGPTSLNAGWEAGRVRSAADRAAGAVERWREVEPTERAAVLERLADAIEPQATEIGEEMAGSIGKPVRYGTVEVARTAEMLRAVAARAIELTDAKPGSGPRVARRPVGLVCVVTPWNNPAYIPLGKIGPALAFGNAVVWKPAPAAAAVSRRIAELLADVGLPESIVEIVPGGADAAREAMSDPAVTAVTLTGSSAAGFAAQEICARRRVPLQAELGGNNAALVWRDADLEHAARELAEGAFAQAGQRCTANRRLVVHADRRDEFLELLVREVAAMPWGNPRDPETRIGPLLDARSRDAVAAALGRVERGAASIVVPHGASSPRSEGFDGAFQAPAIVRCEDAVHELVQEETFGPVLVVQTARDWGHAIELVNGVRHGLVAALFTTSEELAERFPREAEAGIVKINRSTADAEVDVPFGGWKWSGIGPPEHGGFDRDFYTRPQVVYPAP